MSVIRPPGERRDRRAKDGPGPARRALAILCLTSALAFAAWPAPGAAPSGGRPAAPDPLVIPRIKGPVDLDGLSDEPAWRGIPALELVTHSPNFGRAPSERTELLVAYDDQYLYVAGRLFDSEPGKVQANSRQRDAEDASSDWFGVIIDSFNDKENALAFFTTPAGLRWDAAVFNDAVGEDPLNRDWNSFWDAAAARDERGWFAELRIPLSSLRFEVRDGRVVMGLISWRSIARKNEWDVFPDIPPKWGFWSLFKPSQAREVVLEGVRNHSPFYVTPHILAGASGEAEPDGSGAGFRTVRRRRTEAGLDVKYGLTNNLTLDLTVNPDFAQVEADDRQVNLTRFSLFFPEKRPFFQERASIFDFTFESSEPNRLFYSRRIGLDGDRLAPIYAGVRLVGRTGGWDIGFLDLHTDGPDGLGSENSGVLRVRRQIFNPYSYAGAIVTSRLGPEGRFNLAYGLDAQVRIFGDDYVLLKWAQSFQNGLPNPVLSLEPARIYAGWVRRTNKGFGYGASYSRAGADYDPGLGFELRHDFSRYVGSVFYGLAAGPSSSWFMHNFCLTGILWTRNADGSTESGWASAYWRFETKSGFVGIVEPQIAVEDLRQPFALSEAVTIPAGRYDFGSVAATLQTPPVRTLSLTAKLNAGAFYDGRRVSLVLSPLWNVSAGLGLMADYEYDRVRFPARACELQAHIVRLRILAMLNVRLSGSAFLQYSSEDKTIAGNLRLRFNPREGVDLYLVYNETLNTNRLDRFPVPPRSAGRALMVKAAYAFDF